MNRTYYIGIGLILFLLVVTYTLQLYAESRVLNSVKSGEKELTCHMKDGVRVINKDLVVDYEDGVFYFVNGSSKTCSLK